MGFKMYSIRSWNNKMPSQKQLNKNMVLTILAATIASCSLLGPKYKKPEINTPQSFSHESGVKNLKVESIALCDDAWWKKFNDPVLNHLIMDALKNNNDIQVAIGNITAAKFDLEKSKNLWLPTVGLGGVGFVGQGFNQSVSSSNPGLAGGFQNTTNFSGVAGGFVPAYSLNIFQNLKTTEIAKLNLDMQRVAKNSVRLSVISQVTGSYFTLLSLQKRLSIQENMIVEARDLRDYELVKIKNGTSVYSNLAAIDQFIAEISTAVPNIKHNIVVTENAIQVLTNQNPASIIVPNNLKEIKTYGMIPINLPSGVLKNRPDIMMAEYQLQISNAKIGLNMSRFFPTISLTSPIGLSSFQLGNLFSGSTDFWMTQLSATMPVLDMSIYSDIKKSKADYYAAYYNYIRAVRLAFADVDDNLSKYDAANKVYQLRAKELEAAKKIYASVVAKYQAGASSYSDTINMKLNVNSVLINMNQDKLNQLNGIVNLYQGFAAGYNVKNNESMTKFNDEHDI